MGSRKQGWDAEGQWTRVARPWLRSAYCAWLQSLGRKEIHLDHWGRVEAGAVELRNSATGREEEGAEDWVVAIAMLGFFSMSHLMCGAAGGTRADLELA